MKEKEKRKKEVKKEKKVMEKKQMEMEMEKKQMRILTVTNTDTHQTNTQLMTSLERKDTADTADMAAACSVYSLSDLILKGVGEAEDVLLRAALQLRRHLHQDLRKKRRRQGFVCLKHMHFDEDGDRTDAHDDRDSNLPEASVQGEPSPTAADAQDNAPTPPAASTAAHTDEPQLFQVLDLALPLQQYDVDIGSILKQSSKPLPWRTWIRATHPGAFRVCPAHVDASVRLEALELVLQCLRVEDKHFSKTTVSSCAEEVGLLLRHLQQQQTHGDSLGSSDSGTDKENSSHECERGADEPLVVAVGPTTPSILLHQRTAQLLLQENEAMVKAPNTTTGSHRVFKMTRVVQASREVRGRSLDDIVASEDWDAVNDLSLGRTFLLTLLLTADDAKGDNFMVTPNGDIIGIDNDHVLGAPFKASGAGTRVVLRSLIFCCNPWMSRRMHPALVQHLRRISPTVVVSRWLAEIGHYNDRLRELERDGLLSPSLRTALGLPCYVRSSAVERTLLLLRRVQTAVKARDARGQEVTLKGLLQSALPEVAAVYTQMRGAFTTPHEALRCVYFRPEEFFPRPPPDLVKYDITVEGVLAQQQQQCSHANSNSGCCSSSDRAGQNSQDALASDDKPGCDDSSSTTALRGPDSGLDCANALFLERDNGFVQALEDTMLVTDVLAKVHPKTLCIQHVMHCLEIVQSCSGMAWSLLPQPWTSDTTLVPSPQLCRLL
ncbi:hypothetical protein PTSG_01257 [Salpingoeca rosetta]|uniref:Uncharacterized protein n=1 Tax=Salpingoeca rosetta (strain ATCC 50818 / BSB-021) TaxID=946362 RepID=F2TZT9_SALR5|nr:uncharacterized protein PTSG_01257 [Salpingoeca rosetta]EGD80667.1 hypothetical protein PTSG_01257 [Salpingoeca rosetta]|eukprot:XP_004997228.1 hypothetical protein PTSG_01257 [Salpingoeca rosetta]